MMHIEQRADRSRSSVPRKTDLTGRDRVRDAVVAAVAHAVEHGESMDVSVLAAQLATMHRQCVLLVDEVCAEIEQALPEPEAIESKADEAKVPVERRMDPRTRTVLAGRYAAADGTRDSCKIVEVSAAGMVLVARTVAAPGNEVVIRTHEFGMIRGEIVRHTDNGFVVQLTDAASRKVARRIIQELSDLAWSNAA